MPHPRLRRLLLAGSLPLFLAACASDAPSAPAPADPQSSTRDGVTLAVVSGGGQSGAPGQTLAEPVVVRVTGRGGAPLAGHRVGFQGSGHGDLDPQVVLTDAEGYARTFWTLGEGAGVQQVRASGTAGTVVATARARPGLGTRVALVKRAGDEQTVEAGALLSDLVQVAVVRDDGTMVPGAVVAFAAGQGGRVERVDDPSAPAGVVTARWTLGPAGGAQTLTVSTPGATPVTFTASATGGSSPNGATLRVVPDSLVLDAGARARMTAVIGGPEGAHVPESAPSWLISSDAGAGPPPENDPNGTDLPGVAPVWSSSNAAVATVDSVGNVQGVAVGTARITARVGALSASATVRVRAPAAASIQVLPDSLVLEVNATGQLTVVVRDAMGAVIPGQAPAWTSSDPAVATVDAQGQVRGVSAGTAQVTACLGSLCASASVRVRAGNRFPSLELFPDSLVLDVGVWGKLFPVARDASGTAILDYTLEWTTSNDQVVFVMSDGALLPQSAGTAVVTARWGTLTASVPVRVRTPRGGSLRIPQIQKRVMSTGGHVDPSTRDVGLKWWIHVSQRNVSALTMRIRSPQGRIIDCPYADATSWYRNEFSCELLLPQGSEPGVWRVDRVTVTTSTGTTTFSGEDLADMGTLGRGFSVLGTGTDTVPPRVGSLWTYAGSRRADGYYISVGLMDVVSGVRSARLTVRGPGGVTHSCVVSKSYGELAKAGGGVCLLPLRPGSGTWDVVSVEVEDGAGNRATYTPQQIAELASGISEAPFFLYSFTP